MTRFDDWIHAKLDVELPPKPRREPLLSRVLSLVLGKGSLMKVGQGLTLIYFVVLPALIIALIFVGIALSPNPSR